MTGLDRPGRGAGILDALPLGVLTLDGALLGVFGLMFNPIHVGTVALPVGALFTVLILPWLVGRAAEVDPRRLPSAAPLLAWAVTLGVVGFLGPGGDVLLPGTWQSLLLCAGGLTAGFVGLRRAGAQTW